MIVNNDRQHCHGSRLSRLFGGSPGPIEASTLSKDVSPPGPLFRAASAVWGYRSQLDDHRYWPVGRLAWPTWVLTPRPSVFGMLT